MDDAVFAPLAKQLQGLAPLPDAALKALREITRPRENCGRPTCRSSTFMLRSKTCVRQMAISSSAANAAAGWLKSMVSAPEMARDVTHRNRSR